MTGFPWQNAFEIRSQIAEGQTAAIDVARAYLDRIETLNPQLRCFLVVDHEGALAAASQVDRAREAGEPLGPLAGVPVALKDNLCTRGVPTTCASKILEGYVPPYDAHVVEALRQAGAVIVGKTNLDEFAMGSSNENSAFASVNNPWGTDRAPGGSSGGSACATAAGLTALALGSDTGGSVRQPAAFCGVTAIKPTYGRVSRSGLIAFASSLDQVGPMARSVREAARLLEVIATHDPRDATSADQPVGDYHAACDRDVPGPSHRRRACSARWRSRYRCQDDRRSRLGRARQRRRHTRRRRASARQARGLGLLPDRPSRGVEQPRSLRRHALRASRPGRRPHRHVQRDPRPRIWPRGTPQDHARHVRPLGRDTTTPSISERNASGR